MGYIWKLQKLKKKKAAINTTLTRELNHAVRKFWKLYLKLDQQCNEYASSQNDKTCLNKLKKIQSWLIDTIKCKCYG